MSPRRWLALVFMVVAGAGKLGCAKKAPAEAFSCERFQQRAEACEPQTLSLIRQRMQALDASPEVTEQQYKMVEIRFRKRIQERRAQRQCEKALEGDAGSARATKLRECFASAGCEAFAACILDAS